MYYHLYIQWTDAIKGCGSYFEVNISMMPYAPRKTCNKCDFVFLNLSI